MTKYTLTKCLKCMNSRKNWYNKSFSGYLFGIAQQGLAVSVSEKASQYAIPYGINFQNYSQIDHLDWIWDNELLVEKRNQILKAVRKDGTFTREFFKKWQKSWGAYLKEWESAQNTDFNKLSVSEIRNRLKPLHKKYIDHATQAYIVDTFLNDSKIDWLAQEIQRAFRNKVNSRQMVILTAPVYESFVNEFEVRKLKIALQIINSASGAAVKKAVRELAKEFFWIRANYFNYLPIGEKLVMREVLEEVKKYGKQLPKKIYEESARIENNRKEKQALLNSLKASKELRRVIESAEVFTNIQDRRKQGVLRTNTIFYRALEALSKKIKVPKGLPFYLVPSELLDDKKFAQIDWKYIQARREKGTMTIFCNNDAYTYTRDEYEKLINVKVFFQDFAGHTEVRGSVAFPGFIRGVGRVVKNGKGIESFKPGEILITNQTTPEFVPAMKKAVAFVTDQGGITCHAAIVAREMKKPCVIGTKNATKVFKDGDMVEVDANKGIVRKIDK